MAYMCTDSGNLMALAQQLINQKKEQEQNQDHRQDQQNPNFSGLNQLCSTPWTVNQSFTSNSSMEHELAGAAFSDQFQVTGAGESEFQFPDFVSGTGGEFDSDEWVHALMDGGDFTESSILQSCCDTCLIGSDPCSACPSRLSTDLNSVIFSETRKLQQNDVVEEGISPILKTLTDCATIAEIDPKNAAKSLIQIRNSVSQLGDPTERVAYYFAEALHRRLTKSPVNSPASFESSPEELTLCYKLLDDACPYTKFTHLTANQAILEATERASKIHIIDFGIVHGVQWPALLQALATRSAGKPDRIRISGVASPEKRNSSAATGNRLRDFARVLDLNFEFDLVIDPTREINGSSFRVDPDEKVAVNIMLQLYDSPGVTNSTVTTALKLAKSLNPTIVTLCEYGSGLDRVGSVKGFKNTIKYYLAMFESLDSNMARESPQRLKLESLLLGRRIFELVEGNNRECVGDEEELRAVMKSAGFDAVGISHYAKSQAKLLLWDYGYSSSYNLIDSSPGFLSLAWNDVPLLTVSSWH